MTGVLFLDEARATRDAMRYGFAVGKMRVLQTRVLDRSDVERLLDARTFADQKRLLAETPYARYLEDAATPRDVERALDDALDGFYAFLDEAELPPAVTRFFRLRYDFANLKAVLKARALSVPVEGLLVGHGTIEGAEFETSPEDLPGRMGAAAAASAGSTDTAAVDAAVDEAYFAELADTADAAGSPYLAELTCLQIDAANIRALIRSALAGLDPAEIRGRLIPGGGITVETLSAWAGLDAADIAQAVVRLKGFKGVSAEEIAEPATLDPALESLMTAALRRGRASAAGPDPVIAYVLGREAEVRTLRVLLLGRLTGIDDETLRVRVNASYR